MKRYDNIIQDNLYAPKTDNNIWLKDHKLYYYTNGKWQLIGGDISTNDIKEIKESLSSKADKSDLPDVSKFVDDAEYKDQRIYFKNNGEDIFYLEAAPFIKDGMVKTVSIEGDNLVVTFNTDAGLGPFSIPLSKIFDPNNYYDKDAIDDFLKAIGEQFKSLEADKKVGPHPKANQLLYRSSTGEKIEPGNSCDTSHIISNEYYPDKDFGLLTFDEDLTEIPVALFSGRSALVDIHIPEGITKVGNSAFYQTGLKKLILPNSCEVVEQYAVRLCGALEEVYAPNANFEGTGAFKYSSSKLKYIRLSKNQKELGTEFFRYTNLQAIDLGGVTKLGMYSLIGGDGVYGFIKFIDGIDKVTYFCTNCMRNVLMENITINANAIIESGAFSAYTPKRIFSAKSDITNFPPVNNLEILKLTSNTVVKELTTYVSTFEAEPKPVAPVPRTISLDENGEPKSMPLANLDTYIGTPNNWLKIYVPEKLLKEYQETYPTLKNHLHPITGEDIYATKEYIDDVKKSILGSDALNESYDTLQEVAEWIENHSGEASELISDINEVKEWGKNGFSTGFGHFQHNETTVTTSYVVKSVNGKTANTYPRTIAPATQTTAGVMSATDKANLDRVVEEIENKADLDEITQVNQNLNELQQNISQVYTSLKDDFDALLNEENLNDSFDSLKEVDTWIKSHEGETLNIIQDINNLNTKVESIPSYNRAFVASLSINENTENTLTIRGTTWGRNGSGYTNVTIKAATNEKAGVMSASDKQALDNLVANSTPTLVKVPVIPNDTVIEGQNNHYYRIDDVIDTLDIRLPYVEEDEIVNFIVYFTTGGSPIVDISNGQSLPISYFKDFAIEANTTYELNIMFNGNKWVVGYAVVEQEKSDGE